MTTEEREKATREWQERETARRAPLFWFVKDGEVFDSFDNFHQKHLTRERVLSPDYGATAVFDREEDARAFAVPYADAVEARREQARREAEDRSRKARAEFTASRKHSRTQLAPVDPRRGWTEQERFNDEPNMPWDEA